jgi:hypothetical protein
MAEGASKWILQTGGVVGACLLFTVLAGCESTGAKKDDASAADAAGKPAQGSNVNVSFLLTMTFDEAKKLSPASDTMPPFYKVAADQVTVTSRSADNSPKRLRAKGKVYVQIDYREKASALAQEALISPDEVILRGKPLLKRGRTVVEGLDDTTVFYVRGVDLQVIGKHRITSETGVTPTWSRSWKEGPNPLLPALSPSDVPKEMRASPLLPPPPIPVLPPSAQQPSSSDEGQSRSPLAPKMREPQDRAIGTPPST